MVDETDGLYLSIDDTTLGATPIGAGACEIADFGGALERVSELVLDRVD